MVKLTVNIKNSKTDEIITRIRTKEYHDIHHDHALQRGISDLQAELKTAIKENQIKPVIKGRTYYHRPYKIIINKKNIGNPYYKQKPVCGTIIIDIC